MLGFSKDKPIVGVVHLLPLPGSPRFESMESVKERALNDAKDMIQNGVDGLIIENYGDKPFKKTVSKMTVSALSAVCSKVKDRFDVPIGLNVLRNDWKSALSISHTLDLDFVRINVYSGCYGTPSGYIEGEAGEIQRFREKFDMETFIMADIDVKHAKSIYPEDIKTAALDATERGMADGLIVTGDRTGRAVDLEDLKAARENVNVPIFAGSGVDDQNVIDVLRNSDGIIVGTYLKEDGITSNRVSPERVKNLVKKVEEIRT
ncbi:MAG: BtpA/SgcQ family protein [Candidatus Thermoplasmatota archaeon]|nr:BtpA/SgcQ family protein [Candidatus Thermoplasmatota archaeon]